MLSSIHPFGERIRNNRYGLTVASYVFGSAVGGALAGAGFGGLGSAMRTVVEIDHGVILMMGAFLAAIGIAFDIGLGRLKLPSLRRQVNEDWLTAYRNWVYGLGWGLQLGFGLMTIVPSASIYMMYGLIFLNGSWVAGLMIGTFFGVTRASMIFTMVRVDSPDRLRTAHRRLQSWASNGHRIAIGGLAVATIILGGGAIWP